MSDTKLVGKVGRNQAKGGYSYMLSFRTTRISCAGVVMPRSSARRRTYSMDCLLVLGARR